MSMERPRHNLGRVTWIGSEAVGVPGQRTFRLLIQAEGTAAQLWLEKEQLQALAEAIARLLIEIDSEKEGGYLSGVSASENPKPADFPAHPEIEFHIGTLGLRYDPQRSVIALEAYEREADEAEGATAPVLRCLVTTAQLEALQNNSIEVISAGRPRCPLCGTPLTNPGMPHFCPPTNGHQKLTSDDDEE